MFTVSRKNASLMVGVSGLFICLLSLLRDFIDVGTRPFDFGVRQLTATIVGVAVLLLGIVISRRSTAALVSLGAALGVLALLGLHHLQLLTIAYGPPRLPDGAFPPARPPAESILHYDSIPPELKVTRTMLLNTLIERYGYQSYLEIGQGKRFDNFDWVNCRIKIGVDPDTGRQAAYQTTSDEFFGLNRSGFDLVFVDGLHHADQVERDIVNALKVLNDNGTIVVHDCNPTTVDMQVVPQPARQAWWTGDVWKTWVKLRAIRPDLKMAVVDTESGCGIIRRGAQTVIRAPEHLSYEVLQENRRELLNLVSVETFLKDLQGRAP